MKHLLTTTSLVFVAIACATANADVRMEITQSYDDPGKKNDISIVSVRGDQVLFESGSLGEAGSATMIYNAADNSMTQVDHSRKIYMTINEQQLDSAAGQMAEMMKQVEAQLANLPKEQREAMMKAMPGLSAKMGGERAPSRAVQVEWTGKKSKVGGYSCRVATISGAGDGDGIACIATPDELGMSKEDFQTLAAMYQSMANLSSRFGDSGVPQVPDFEEIGGVPISTDASNGDTRSVMTAISTDKLDAAAFSIPDGYQQQTLPSF